MLSICLVGERERANLVVQLGRAVVIYISYVVGARQEFTTLTFRKTCKYVNPTPRPGCNYYTTNGQRQERLQRQQRRLAAETAQEREERLRQLSANQQRRLAAETAQEREERLRQLSHNHQCKMEEAIHNSCVAPARHNAQHLSSNNGGGISYVLLNAHARSLRGEFKGQSRQEKSLRF